MQIRTRFDRACPDSGAAARLDDIVGERFVGVKAFVSMKKRREFRAGANGRDCHLDLLCGIFLRDNRPYKAVVFAVRQAQKILIDERLSDLEQ